MVHSCLLCTRLVGWCQVGGWYLQTAASRCGCGSWRWSQASMTKCWTSRLHGHRRSTSCTAAVWPASRQLHRNHGLLPLSLCLFLHVYELLEVVKDFWWKAASQWAPPKFPLFLGDTGPHMIHGSLGTLESIPPVVSRSVQLFQRSSWVVVSRHTHWHTDQLCYICSNSPNLCTLCMQSDLMLLPVFVEALKNICSGFWSHALNKIFGGCWCFTYSSKHKQVTTVMVALGRIKVAVKLIQCIPVCQMTSVCSALLSNM